MRGLRRSQYDARFEIMPLIDVIFLLLTFFVYAMVLMIRADVLPVELQAYASGSFGPTAPAITVSLDRNGKLFVDREPVEMDALVDALRARTADLPDAVIYVAAEAEGEMDRLPAFLELYDRLAPTGLNVKLVGPPAQ